VQPRPVHRALIGLALGIALGLALTLLWEALDIRVRTAEEVAEHLGLPLLARIPPIPRRLRDQERLVLLRDPDGVLAESFRILASNLDFVKLDRNIRLIMVTSGTFAEGKSTVAANLAATLARAGRRVAIIDLDLRRPTVASFFGVEAEPGVTDVALNRVSLNDALVTVAVGEPGEERGGTGKEQGPNGSRNVYGVLEVLPSGPIPPNPGEFIALQPIHRLLEALRERVDMVVIDAPPMIQVGDAITLSGWADGLIVVSRLGAGRRPLLTELRRVLRTCPAHELGVVVTGVESGEGAAAYYGPPRKSRLFTREKAPVS
jgi:non-specific protein-tyrosine kinase